VPWTRRARRACHEKAARTAEVAEMRGLAVHLALWPAMRARSGRQLSESECEESESEFPPLAEKWDKSTDPNGATYYFNADTQVSSWDPPWKLPEGCEEFTDDADGRTYYHNSGTGATVWDRPWIIPEGYTEWADESEPPRPYFRNDGTGATVWDRPYPIPKGWEEYYDDDKKKPYFSHKTLGITVWDRPWPLPDGWLICKRTSDNKVYYAPKDGTGETVWDRPLLGDFAPEPTEAPVVEDEGSDWPFSSAPSFVFTCILQVAILQQMFQY
jgi:hypothetical protein